MAAEAVLNYLQITNRPYSANDILINLHKEYGKTAIQKALDVLVQDNKVLEKTYGKQKVYVVKQEDVTEGLEDEIKEIDSKITELSNQIQDMEMKVKSKENELKNIQTTLTTEEAKQQIEIVKTKLEAANEKLDSLMNKKVEPICPKKMEALTKQRQTLLKEYRSRKRMCTDIIEAILDGYPKPKRALLEEMGIETDEDVQFSVSNN